MNYAEYQPQALQTEKMYPEAIKRLEHALLGMISETGEIASTVKRIAIYGKDINSDNKSGGTLFDNMIEETGDDGWYCAIPFNVFGAPMEAAGGFGKAQGVPDEFDLKSAVCVLTLLSGRFYLFLEQFKAGEDTKEQLLAITRERLAILEEIAKLLKVPMSVILKANNVKLVSGESPRYGAAGYSDAAAEDRADKGGLDHKES